VWHYFDQAATSYPKPRAVTEAMVRALEEAGGNPGRSGHRLSLAAAEVVEDARDRTARFFDLPDPSRLVFTRNVTESLNIALKGLLRPGDRVVTTGLEHNSVMRPLRSLERRGVEVCVVPHRPDTTLDLDAWEAALRPGARMAVFVQASNVTGTIMPAREMVSMAHRYGALTVMDAAQGAGHLPLSVRELELDVLAFTGHKGLLGPPGTGGLYVAPGVDPDFWEEGGTGSRSELEVQPDFYPDRLESGTPNTPGIAGLAAGIAYLEATGLDAIRRREQALTRRFLTGLTRLEDVTVYGPRDPELQTAVVSINVAGLDTGSVSMVLDERYEILTRPGLHCSPAAHRTLGTWPTGTVRFAFDHRQSEAEIDLALEAIEEIAAAARG
jgi:cysteine desulfurase/selenocysteine lyase